MLVGADEEGVGSLRIRLMVGDLELNFGVAIMNWVGWRLWDVNKGGPVQICAVAEDTWRVDDNEARNRWRLCQWG